MLLLRRLERTDFALDWSSAATLMQTRFTFRYRWRFSAKRIAALLVACAVVAHMGLAGAAGGFSAGASVVPDGQGVVIGVQAGYDFATFPLGRLGAAETDRMGFGVRADVSFALGSGAGPSLGLAGVVRVRGAGPPVFYLGAGPGVTFMPAPMSGPLLGMYFLTGVSFPLAGDVHASVEFVVSASSLVRSHAVRLGASWQFGGRQ